MSSISRRSVAKGAAWSVPAVAVASAAPAMAASPAPGLQGRVWWTEDCANRVMTIKPDDSGNGTDLYPHGDYGFYVFNTKAAQVSGACMTFTYPASLGKLAWSAASGNGQWQTPAFVSTDGKVNTYQTCYTGSFSDNTYVDTVNNSTYYASVTSYPSFSAPISTSCQNPLTIQVTRTVMVGGHSLSFGRTVTINFAGFAAGAYSQGG